MQIGVITNPNSRKNKDRPNRARELQEIVGRFGEVHATDSVQSIKPILRDFLRQRARYWVSDGGDGALHWIVRNGLELLEEDEFRGGDFQLPITIPTNGGTIDFVAGNVGITGQAEGILESLRHSIEIGSTLEEVEVDSMRIEGIALDESGHESTFRTYGFASAVGGVGQRFFTKYYQEKDPNSTSILKVIGNTLASIPIAFSPLSRLPLPGTLKTYASDIFEPVQVRVTLDGMILPDTHFTSVHIASMAIDLGGVFRFFSRADKPGQMHAIVGSPTPLAVVRNLGRMHSGKPLVSSKLVDRECRSMIVETTGDELLAPIIDGECYQQVKKLSFTNGPRLRIPKISGARH